MEEPLPSGGSCLLGSINLSEFVTDDQLFDYEDFKHCVRITIKALNDVLDEGLPLHPLQEQRDSVRNWRQIGAGIFGLGDMLIKMGITYGSAQSIALCNRIASTMIDEAIRSSALLAKYNGAYPKYKNEIKKSEFFIANTSEETRELVRKYGLRNSQLLTTAPTGTLSSMLGVSGGIEPIFANYYTRKTESLKGYDEYYKVYTPIVKKYMEEHGLKDDSELPEYFVTAPEINYKDRIRMQSIWQSHIDASISSTINLPNSATVEDVEDLYLYAWEQGLKGVTIFRDGCKRAGILTTDKNTKKENDKKNNNTMNHVENTKIKSVPHKKLERGMIIKADDNCIGKKRTLRTGCGTLHCEAFFDPDTGQLLETYFSKGSSGGCNQFMIGLSRMISLCARGGVDIYSIVDQLKSSGTCPSYAVRRAVNKDTSLGSSCPVAIGNALIDMYEDMQNEINCDSEDEEELSYSSLDKTSNVVDDRIQDNDNVQNPCPQCGAELVFEGGCNVCKSCGWSKCD